MTHSRANRLVAVARLGAVACGVGLVAAISWRPLSEWWPAWWILAAVGASASLWTVEHLVEESARLSDRLRQLELRQEGKCG